MSIQTYAETNINYTLEEIKTKLLNNKNINQIEVFEPFIDYRNNGDKYQTVSINVYHKYIDYKSVSLFLIINNFDEIISKQSESQYTYLSFNYFSKSELILKDILSSLGGGLLVPDDSKENSTNYVLPQIDLNDDTIIDF